ncbi:hypothetical protein KIN20_035125 [Parelaphostrongylus tenuis]|uniref:Uncharacterized protein n=1 Tax=Parelaphostrongylus tenuis TaxID=148309 RepID=A0AAD5RAN4_PARTN|nr:hypothetical protein KIN20_035125 [Parelaphostrongylus tenuis]
MTIYSGDMEPNDTTSTMRRENGEWAEQQSEFQEYQSDFEKTTYKIVNELFTGEINQNLKLHRSLKRIQPTFVDDSCNKNEQMKVVEQPSTVGGKSIEAAQTAPLPYRSAFKTLEKQKKYSTRKENSRLSSRFTKRKNNNSMLDDCKAMKRKKYCDIESTYKNKNIRAP